MLRTIQTTSAYNFDLSRFKINMQSNLELTMSDILFDISLKAALGMRLYTVFPELTIHPIESLL